VRRGSFSLSLRVVVAAKSYYRFIIYEPAEMSVCLLRIKQPNSLREFIHFNYNKCLRYVVLPNYIFSHPSIFRSQSTCHSAGRATSQASARMIVLVFCWLVVSCEAQNNEQQMLRHSQGAVDNLIKKHDFIILLQKLLLFSIKNI